VVPFLFVGGSELGDLNGIYHSCRARRHDGCPLWERVGGKTLFLFYSSKRARWYISERLEDRGRAYASSDASTPIGLHWTNHTTVEEATGVSDEDVAAACSDFGIRASLMRMTSRTAGPFQSRLFHSASNPASAACSTRMSTSTWMSSTRMSSTRMGTSAVDVDSEASCDSTTIGGGSSEVGGRLGSRPLALKAVAQAASSIARGAKSHLH